VDEARPKKPSPQAHQFMVPWLRRRLERVPTGLWWIIAGIIPSVIAVVADLHRPPVAPQEAPAVAPQEAPPVAPQDADAMNSLGESYYYGRGVAKNYGKAWEWYEKAAAKDDSNAMYKLGLLYEDGLGVAQDYGKACEWYEKAAAKDDSNAM